MKDYTKWKFTDLNWGPGTAMYRWAEEMRKCANDVDSLPAEVRQQLLSGWFAQWNTILYDEEGDWSHFKPSAGRLRYLCQFLSKANSSLALNAEVIGGLCAAIVSGGKSKFEELWELYQSISDNILDSTTRFPLYLVSWEFNNFGSRGRTLGFVNRFKNCDTFESALEILQKITFQPRGDYTVKQYSLMADRFEEFYTILTANYESKDIREILGSERLQLKNRLGRGGISEHGWTLLDKLLERKVPATQLVDAFLSLEGVKPPELAIELACGSREMYMGAKSLS